MADNNIRLIRVDGSHWDPDDLTNDPDTAFMGQSSDVVLSPHSGNYPYLATDANDRDIQVWRSGDGQSVAFTLPAQAPEAIHFASDTRLVGLLHADAHDDLRKAFVIDGLSYTEVTVDPSVGIRMYQFGVSGDGTTMAWGEFRMLGSSNIAVRRWTDAGGISTLRSFTQAQASQVGIASIAGDGGSVLWNSSVYVGSPVFGWVGTGGYDGGIGSAVIGTPNPGLAASGKLGYAWVEYGGDLYRFNPSVGIEAMPLVTYTPGYSFPNTSDAFDRLVLAQDGDEFFTIEEIPSGTTTTYNLPAGWGIYYFTLHISGDGTTVWGSVQHPPGMWDNYYSYTIFRYVLATGQFDTISSLQSGDIYDVSYDGTTAIGDLGWSPWIFEIGPTQEIPENWETTYEENFVSVPDTFLENRAGAGGEHWIPESPWSLETMVCTSAGLVGAPGAWFSWALCDLPADGDDYFVEIDFLENGSDVIGLAFRENETHFNAFTIGEEGSDVLCTIDLVNNGDGTYDFEAGYAYGDGIETSQSFTVPVTPGGTHTLRAEVAGNLAHFYVDDNLLGLFGIRGSTGRYIGVMVSEDSTITAFRSGIPTYIRPPAPDFWQDLTAATEID